MCVYMNIYKIYMYRTCIYMSMYMHRTGILSIYAYIYKFD